MADTSVLDQALQRVGDRWSLLVVDALLAGPRRFGDLEADIPAIASNILSARLKRLEEERLIVAVPYSPRPLRYAYDLTAAGRALAGTLRLLTQWGTEHGHAGAADEGPHHQRCGTALQARWWCPTCSELVDEEPDSPVWV